MSRFVIIVLLLIFLVGLGVCGIAAFRLFQPAQAVTTTDNVLLVAEGENARLATEDYFGTRLPAAPITDRYYFARKDDDYWLRFNVQPNALNGLLADSPRLVCHDLDLLDGLRPEFAYVDLSLEERNALTWWTPDSARTIVGSDCVGEDLTSYKMLVDTSNPSWTVYMEITAPEEP
jgi:hypothetical protein